MNEKIDGIVIDVIKHSDRHNIVTLYTLQRGRVTFMSPVGSSRNTRMRNAMLQPLAYIRTDVNFRPGRELQILPQFSLGTAWRSLYFNPVKSSLVLFITEFLNNILRYSMPDKNLWNYILNSLQVMDCIETKRLANFHISFMVNILSFLGIRPSTDTYKPGMIFDMHSAEFLWGDTSIDGAYSAPRYIMRKGIKRDGDIIDPREAAFIKTLDRINFVNMHKFRFSSQQRYYLLDRLLKYFSIHLSVKSDLKSLEILKDVFS